LSGLNSTTGRLLVNTNVLGTQRVITASTFSLTDVDFADITLVGPPSSTITSDSFNRADDAIGTTDAANGGTAKTWVDPTGLYSIDSNKAKSTSGSRSTAVVDTGTLGQYVEATITLDASTHTTGVVVRSDGDNNMGLAYIVTGAGSIQCIVNGTSQASATVVGLPTFVSGQTLGVKITTGDVVQVFIDGVLRGSYPASTYSTVPTGTYAGFNVRTQLTGRFDNFIVKEVPNVTGTRLGDCLGNSGIDFQTPRTLYAVAPGNFSSSSMWSLSSGGSAGEAPPLPQDDVRLDNNSPAGTYSIDMVRPFRSIDCTGFTRTLGTAGGTITVYGSWTLSSGMVFSPGNPNWVFAGRGSHTITSAGNAFTSSGGLRSVTLNTAGGTYTLGDAAAFGTSNGVSLYVTSGTFNSANYPISFSYEFSSTGAATRTMNLGTSTITCTRAGGGIVTFSGSNLTLNADSSTFDFSVASASPSFFTGGGYTFGTINYTVADSPGALSFSGAAGATINTLNVGPGREIRFQAGTTTKINTLNIDSSPTTPTITSGLHSVPDSAALRLLGDFDIRVRLYIPSWTTNSVTLLVKGYNTQPGWYIYKHISNGWYYGGSVNGTNWSGLIQNGNAFQDGLTGAQTAWVRFTRNASTGQLRAYRAVDLGDNTMPSTWIEMTHSPNNSNAAVNLVAPASPHPLTLGSQETGGFMQNPSTNGTIFHRVQIRNNVLNDGTGIILDLEPSSRPYMDDTLSDSYGNTMTVTSGALAADGRVLLRSSVAGSPASLQITGPIDQLDGVDIQDLCVNGTDLFVGGQAKIRSGIKGIRRSPQYGLMV
jgi:hypothetical protein